MIDEDIDHAEVFLDRTGLADANLYHKGSLGGRQLHHWTFAETLPGQRQGDGGIGPMTVLLVCHCGALQRRPLPESVG